MLESAWISIPVGILLGFLTGLGTGGGSLLILWLTMALHMEQPQARVVNLLFFLPSALIACFFRWRQGKLDFQCVLPAIIGGCVSAVLFSWIGTVLDLELLKKLFGILLLFAGARELLYRPRKPK